MLKSLDEPQIGDIELSRVIDPSKSTGNLSVVAGSVGYVPPGIVIGFLFTFIHNRMEVSCFTNQLYLNLVMHYKKIEFR